MDGNQDKPQKPKIVRKTKTLSAKQQVASLSSVAAEKKPSNMQQPNLFTFTLQVLYKNLYILGITLLRRGRRYIKRINRAFIRIKGRSYAILERVSLFLISFRKELVRKIERPFIQIAKVRSELAPVIELAKSAGEIPMTSYLKVAFAWGRLVWTVLRTVLNHVAPLAAVWLLLYTVNLYVDQPLGLEVIYNNESIGYIKNESEFEQATQILRDRFIVENNSGSVFGVPKFVLVSVKDNQEHPVQWLANKLMRMKTVNQEFTSTEELANRMVELSGGNIERAYGFYVDNQFYGAVTDRDHITSALEEIREENLLGYPDERIDFVKKITLKPGIYPIESLVSTDAIDNIIYSDETQEQVYIVQDNDTPTGIADKTGVSYSLLRLMNPGIEDSLPIGHEIYTEVARPFLSVKNIYTSIYTEEFPFDVDEIKTSTYDRNYKEVTQEGKNGSRQVKAEITRINGIETERVPLEVKVLREAVPQKVILGTNDPKAIKSGTSVKTDMSGSSNSAGSSGFIWPTLGGTATTYRNHSGNGVDIPRNYGTPIYAAASGTVVRVRSGISGYGNHIMIDHGNGYQTLYAHASALHVTVGQSVSQGQVIASIGRTGMATGNHLHFEVIQNGRYMYPVNYIGKRG